MEKYILYSTDKKSFLKEVGKGYSKSCDSAHCYTKEDIKINFYNQFTSGFVTTGDKCTVIAIPLTIPDSQLKDDYIIFNAKTKKYKADTGWISNALEAKVYNDTDDRYPTRLESYDDLIVPINSELNKVFFENLKSVPVSTTVEINSQSPKRYLSRLVDGKDVIDLCKHWELNFNEGNILKYLLRKKGEDISDLKKIIDYAQRELNHLEKNEKV